MNNIINNLGVPYIVNGVIARVISSHELHGISIEQLKKDRTTIECNQEECIKMVSGITQDTIFIITKA